MLTLFLEDLTTAGYSRSAGRIAVFKYLLAVGAATPSQFASEMVGQLDRSSLYRTLALFRRLGIIDDIGVGSQRTIELSDRYAPHHHHLRCRNCGHVTNLDEPKLETTLRLLARSQGFTLEGHVIELTGLCMNCQN